MVKTQQLKSGTKKKNPKQLQISKSRDLKSTIKKTQKLPESQQNQLCEKFTTMTIKKHTNTLLTERYISLGEETIKKLKIIYMKSNEDRIEFSGSIGIEVNKNAIQLKSPSINNRGNRGSCAIFFKPITYHTHPMSDRINNNKKRNLFTLPSQTDIMTYIKSYPKTQVNLILDYNGYYVIDLHEAKPVSDVRQYWEDRIIPVYKIFWKRIAEFQKILAEEIKSNKGTSYQFFIFHYVAREKFKKYINTTINKLMKKVGVKINYYFWEDKGPSITIKGPKQVWQNTEPNSMNINS